MNNKDRDAVVALIVSAIVLGGVFVIALALQPNYRRIEMLGSFWSVFSWILWLWADHRSRMRHQLASFWSTLWRLSVATIPAEIIRLAVIQKMDDGLLVILVAYCNMALFTYIGLRWASGFYEERQRFVRKKEAVEAGIFE